MAAVEDLREAARLALIGRASSGPAARKGEGAARDEAGAAAPAVGRVSRAVLDVTVGGRTEIVTAGLRDGELILSSTAGPGDDAHIYEALRLLSEGAAGLPEASASQPGMRATSPGEVEAALPGPAKAGDERETMRHALAHALEDVLTAVVRVGVSEARVSPTVNDTLERLVSAAPSPLPAAVGRWLGMLRAALSAGDVDTTARILDGAARIAGDLRAESPDEVARRRLVSWLGASIVGGSEVSRISDRTLVELSREYLPGAQRRAIERRHLVCLETGEIFREERVRGTPGLSAGPCPRVVTVGLAEVEEGAPPRRLRLLQYAVSNTITRDQWMRLGEAARRTFRVIAGDYRQALASYPGLAEPFVLVSPRATLRGDGVVLLDGEEDPLPLAEGEASALTAALLSFIGEDEPDWVAGRLIDAEGTLLLVPCSVGISRGMEHRILRLA